MGNAGKGAILSRERMLPFFAQVRGGMPPAGGGGKGAILFRKREWPLWTPKRKALIGNLELEQLSCLRSESACVAALLTLAAIGFTIRFASVPIIRCCAAVGGSAALRMRHTPCGCRSAHLIEVRSNHRLPECSSMRRAQQCRIQLAVRRRGNVTRASR